MQTARAQQRHGATGCNAARPSCAWRPAASASARASGTTLCSAAASLTGPVAEASMALIKEPVFEVDKAGLERVKYEPAGWNYWTWKGQHRIHWVAAGPEDAPAVVLVHGYGASAYHWRYQLAALSKQYRVYAVCLLGFGLSEKAVVDYNNAKQWVGQLSDFIKEVVGGKPAALVGNSLGGYASLATAANHPELVRGVALLNGAGPLQEAGKPVLDPDGPISMYDQMMYAMTGLMKRVALYFAFQQAKQPQRIKDVLNQVYVHKAQVDDELVDSIVKPATDPSAAYVFYLLNHRTRPPVTLNSLLAKLQSPVLLLWGMRDPWMSGARALSIKELYPAAKFVPLNNAGHCPHDDLPTASNEALMEWLKELPTTVNPVSLSQVAERVRVSI